MCFNIPEVRVERTTRSYSWLPCTLPGGNDRPKLPWLKPELSDGNSSSCVWLFPMELSHVNRFQAYIVLASRNLTTFQVSVLTGGPVECKDPDMVVMSDAEDCGGLNRRQRQCGLEEQHDTTTQKGRPRKICIFQCVNPELIPLITVTVQFNKKPWIEDEKHLKICEIEADTLLKYDLDLASAEDSMMWPLGNVLNIHTESTLIIWDCVVTFVWLMWLYGISFNF